VDIGHGVCQDNFQGNICKPAAQIARFRRIWQAVFSGSITIRKQLFVHGQKIDRTEPIHSGLHTARKYWVAQRIIIK